MISLPALVDEISSPRVSCSNTRIVFILRQQQWGPDLLVPWRSSHHQDEGSALRLHSQASGKWQSEAGLSAEPHTPGRYVAVRPWPALDLVLLANYHPPNLISCPQTLLTYAECSLLDNTLEPLSISFSFLFSACPFRSIFLLGNTFERRQAPIHKKERNDYKKYRVG